MKTKKPYVITFDGRKINVDSIYYFPDGDILARTNIGRENEEEFRVKGQFKDATLYRGKYHYNTIKESRDYRKDQARFFEEEMKKSWRERGENYKDNELNKGMLNAACGEISFHRLCEEHLISVLNEIEVLCSMEGVTKEVIKGVIANAKERRNIDRIIHTQKLFPSQKGFSS